MSRIPLKAVVTAVLFAMAATSAFCDDWPQWRGPNRDAISLETGLMDSWTSGGPKLLWQKPLGEGFSCMAVAQGRVFTLFQDPKGQYLASLDEKTGDKLWTVRTGDFYEDRMGGNGPRSTPTVDGSRVYVFDALGNLVCVEAASGKEVWRCDTLKKFGAKNLTWAASMSPLVDGEKLIVNVGESDGSSIVAFDKATGDVIWKALNDAAGYSSPIERTIGGALQLVFFNATGALGVTPDKGDVLWRFPWKTSYDVHAATPIVRDDLVFITSGYNSGCALFRVDLKAPVDKRATEVWRSKIIRSHFGTPVLIDGYLYGFDEKTFRCVDFMTGEGKWEDKGFQKGSLVLAGGMAYVLGEKGRLALAKLSPEKLEIVSEVANPGEISNVKCWTMPVVANGRLFLRDQSKIVCLDVKAK
jgi:outer membrane protein assembly factor BamB